MRCGGRVRERQGEGQERSKGCDGRQIRTTAQACDNIQRAEGSQCGAGPATDILTPGKSAASSRPGLPTPLGTASPISSLVNATMSENIAAAQQARVDGQIGQLPSQFGLHLLILPRPLPPVTCRTLQRRYRVGCVGSRLQYSPRWVVHAAGAAPCATHCILLRRCRARPSRAYVCSGCPRHLFCARRHHSGERC